MEIFNVSKRTEELRLMRLIQHEDVSTKHAVQHAIRDVRWYNFHVATRADRNVLCVRILTNQRQLAVYRQAVNDDTGRIYSVSPAKIVLYRTYL